MTFSRRAYKKLINVIQESTLREQKLTKKKTKQLLLTLKYLYKSHQKPLLKMDLLSELQHAEFKEAFDEFDKVSLDVTTNTMLFIKT